MLFSFCFVEDGSVDDYAEKVLEKLDKNNAKGILAIFQGFMFFISKDYSKAIQMCNEGNFINL